MSSASPKRLKCRNAINSFPFFSDARGSLWRHSPDNISVDGHDKQRRLTAVNFCDGNNSLLVKRRALFFDLPQQRLAANAVLIFIKNSGKLKRNMIPFFTNGFLFCSRLFNHFLSFFSALLKLFIV